MDDNLQTQHHENRIPALDGLRGLAILLVLSFHYSGSTGKFNLGWSGVDLFFVLSGFLITGKLVDSANGRGYFSHFYRNRILRIFPLYYLILILFFTAVFFLAKNEHGQVLSPYREHWLSYFIFTENWTFISFGQDKYLAHFWSIAMEEQFYIFWPFLIYFFTNKKGLLSTLLVAIPCIVLLRIFLLSQNPSRSGSPDIFFNSFCRMDSFIMGALVSISIRTGQMILMKWVRLISLISLLLVVLGILVYNAKAVNPFFSTIGITLLAVFYACLLYMAIQPGTGLFIQFLIIPFLRFCGKISYGLYIFHWPILLILGTKLNNWGALQMPGHLFLVHLLSILICLLTTFMISAVSFYYFESYFLRLKKQVNLQPEV
ncbi:MAG TPA: acyltransferase, partial [Puia sp.]|nr:acyltransferase [Puia sp.]